MLAWNVNLVEPYLMLDFGMASAHVYVFALVTCCDFEWHK